MNSIKVLLLVLVSIVSVFAFKLTDAEISSKPVDYPVKAGAEFLPYKGDVPIFPVPGTYLIRSSFEFLLDSSEYALLLPPMPFPVIVVANGQELYRWGEFDKSSCLSNFSAVTIPLKNLTTGTNTVDLYTFTDGQAIALPLLEIDVVESVVKSTFYRTLFNHYLVQAIAVMALFAFFVFIGHAASSRFHEMDILYFSLMTLMLFFGFSPFVFNYPYSNDVIWFKVSRVGYIYSAYFLYAFCSSFTNLLAQRKFKIAFAVLTIPFAILILDADSKSHLNYWFGIFSMLYIIPLMILNAVLLVIATRKKVRHDIVVILIGYIIFLFGVFYDLSYMIKLYEPYAWLTAYTNFVLICTIAYAIYIRQNAMYQSVMMYKTELTYTNQSLITAHQRLLAESLAKEQFIRAIAHEFRTPLNGMLGIVDAVVRDSKQSDANEIHDDMAYLSSSFHRFELTVQNLLDYQELNSGKITLDLHLFSPAQLLRDISHYCIDDAKIKGISLISLVNDTLLPNQLIGDSTRIAVVLNNVIRNAIKFTSEGGVSIKAEYSDGVLKMCVSDTGCGIDNHLQETIFTAFMRGEEIAFTQRYEGIGLGLAIVDALTKKMDGRVEVFSEMGKGTQFYIYIPLEIAQSRTKESAKASILVADDNLVNRKVIVSQLDKLGYTVFAVENGKEAVDFVLKGEYDLVLMDVQMPVMDGLEATLRLRSSFPRLPIIGVTANGDRTSCLDSGMNDVIFKPTSSEELHSIIQSYIQ